MEIEVKERIKGKADELFYKYGIKSVTMDEIASQLGISKKTIYQSFADKDQLVDAVFTDFFSKNEEYCQFFNDKAKDAIHEGFLTIQLMEDRYGNMNPLILYDLQRNHPKTYNKFREHKYSFLYHCIIKNIEQGKKEELFREDLNPDIIARLRLETMLMPFDPNVFPKNKYHHSELQRQLIEFHLFSIVTPKGYKLILKYKDQLNKKGL